MRKTLRLLLVCFMSLFCGTMMAQEVTIDFNENYEALFPGMKTSSGSGNTYVADGACCHSSFLWLRK